MTALISILLNNELLSFLFWGTGRESLLSLLALELYHGSRLVAEEPDGVLVGLGLELGAQSSSEDIFVLLLGEIGIIVSMGMGILLGVISVILPS